jgi:hypothetical protein
MQLLIADQTYSIETWSKLAEWRLDHAYQRVPVELSQPFAFAPANEHGETLHRQIQFQRLNPLDRHAQSVVVTQIVELGMVFAFDCGDPQRLAPAVGIGSFARSPGERREPLQRRPPQIIVMGVHPEPIAVEPASHGAQEGLQFMPYPMIETRGRSRVSIPIECFGPHGFCCCQPGAEHQLGEVLVLLETSQDRPHLADHQLEHGDLLLEQMQHLLFQSAPSDEIENEDLALLTDAVDASDALLMAMGFQGTSKLISVLQN